MTKLFEPSTGAIRNEVDFVIKYGDMVTFPADRSKIDYESLGHYVIVETPQPSYSPLTHKIVSGVPVLNELGRYEEAWDLVALTQAEIDAEIQRQSDDLIAQKNALILKIDADSGALIAQVIGQRGLEYLEAEKQANAYIAANYLGTVPPYVQNWATVKGQTAQWAADNIAATATAWRGASDSLRFNRLQHKENVQNATSIAGLDTIQASWLAFLAGIKASLGVV